MSIFFGFMSIIPENESNAEAMRDNIRFFEGDAVGTYQADHVFICNKFLFNTPEASNTTSICENDRYVVAASCRIDNRQELAAKLNIIGASNASDHDYILAAYTRYEQKCVNHLIGDFAFVIWDKQKQTIFLARDQMGVKPLFYTLQNGTLYFSSDLNAFLNIDGIDTKYSEAYLASMIHGQLLETEISPEHTCYEKIYRLKPAHSLYYKNEYLKIQEYWKLAPAPVPGFNSKDDYYARFFELFEQAVACRLRTYDKVGIELSGGLDSSSIACMAQHISRQGQFSLDKLHTHSLVHSDTSRNAGLTDDEESFQKLVLENLNLKKEQIFRYSSHPFKHFLEEYEYNFNVHGGFTKIGASWQKPIYEGLQENNCRVKLSGFAGDELVSYTGKKWYYDGLNRLDPQFLMSFLSKAPLVRTKVVISYYLGRLFPSRYNMKVNPETNYLNSEYQHLVLSRTHKRSHTSHASFMTSFISRPFTTLRIEAEMLHALRHNAECRYPMTDIRLLEFILCVPFSLFVPEKEIKRMLFRNSLRAILPAEIVNRPTKTTAAMPYFSDKTKKNIEEVCEMKEELSNAKNQKFIDGEKVNKQLHTITSIKKGSDLAALLSTIFLNVKLAD